MSSYLERPGGPSPVIPGRFILADEAKKARHRLYPSTVFYPAQFLAIVTLGLRHHAVRDVAAAIALGLSAWTLVEYLAHRYILHGRFPDGPGLRHLLHRQFDHLHLAHHARPWDGNHVNGTLKDTLAPSSVFLSLALVVAPLSLWPVFVASVMLGYIMEEWVHHAVHFSHFKNAYFSYIKKHHLFHHSARGSEVGFGLTSGLWDAIVGTRIAGPDRQRLYGRPSLFPRR
jgi:sterol desaturase/sphingolipid hydroxylase (fatty acid hydroxylase superfamily)